MEQYNSWNEGCSDLLGKGIFIALGIFILLLIVAFPMGVGLPIGFFIAIVIWACKSDKNKDE